MNKFLTWFKNLVLPFENPEHPLYYSPTQEQDDLEDAVRVLFGDNFANHLFNKPMPTTFTYQIPNTIPARQSKYWGHWNKPELKPARDAAREAARAAGYYDRHTHY
jgi:hypothetical protein